MANVNKEYLDLPGLQQYDMLIKQLIPTPDEVTLTIDSNGVIKIKQPPTVEGTTLKL